MKRGLTNEQNQGEQSGGSNSAALRTSPLTFPTEMPLTKDSVKNFYSIISSEAAHFFGLSLDIKARTTSYFGFRGEFTPFEVPYCHATAVYAGDSRIAFFDYSGCVFGVVDAQDGRLLWDQSIESPGDLDCLWADPESSTLRVQLKKSVHTFDITTGEQTNETRIAGTLKASGPGYDVVSSGKSIAVRTRSGELQFKSANGIQEIRKLDSVLTIVEWQGPARVIDLDSGSMLFEAIPEPGSQFSQIHYTPNGPVVLTQHFFDQPILTDVRFYESASANRWEDSTIGMSGNYAILSTGRQIAYATRGIYDSKSGAKISDF